MFAGDAIHPLPMSARVQRGLVRLYQITSIFKRLTVLENIALAVQAARDGSSWRFWQPTRNETARYQQAAEVADRVGLTGQLHRRWAFGAWRAAPARSGFSVGNAPAHVVTGRAHGMGPEESERMVALLLQLRQDTTILLVEHDMDAVFAWRTEF